MAFLLDTSDEIEDTIAGLEGDEDDDEHEYERLPYQSDPGFLLGAVYPDVAIS